MQRNWIQKCFDSLLSSNIETKIIAIDNGSADGSVEFIQKRYPQVKLFISNENLGFAKANNIGIKYALEQGADYFFLLNQDAWIEKDTIEKLINAFEQMQDTGIVSPIHLNGSKTNLDSGFINYITNKNTPNFISDLYFNKLNTCYETNFINAACWLISRKCIDKVGGFDTSIFYHYGEDVNYCQRVIYHGYNIYINSTTKIYHDRELRLGKRPVNYEKKRKEVDFTVKYANLMLPEENVDGIIHFTKKSINNLHLIIRLFISKFKNKNIWEERKVNKKQLELLWKIKKSREINKKGGLVWL